MLRSIRARLNYVLGFNFPLKKTFIWFSYNIFTLLLVKLYFRDILETSGVPANDVSEVILGQVLAAGQGQNPARQVNHPGY